MIEKFLPRTGFDSYEDFKANYRLNVPGISTLPMM